MTMEHLLPVLTATLVDDPQENCHGKRPFFALSFHQCDEERDVLFAQTNSSTDLVSMVVNDE